MYRFPRIKKVFKCQTRCMSRGSIITITISDCACVRNIWTKPSLWFSLVQLLAFISCFGDEHILCYELYMFIIFIYLAVVVNSSVDTLNTSNLPVHNTIFDFVTRCHQDITMCASNVCSRVCLIQLCSHDYSLDRCLLNRTFVRRFIFLSIYFNFFFLTCLKLLLLVNVMMTLFIFLFISLTLSWW